MKQINCTNEINTKTEEGKLLLAALVRISTEIDTNKTPDKIILKLNKLKNKMFK